MRKAEPSAQQAAAGGAPDCRWQFVADERALQRQALATIQACAAKAIAQRGQFHLVLAGGNTPRAIYRQLATATAQWNAWHVYFGDERCLPAADSERSSRMAADVWLAHVPIPVSQVHPIPAELGAVAAARQYAETLQGVGDFDLVLLGLGEDGHTASLFPDHEWGQTPGSADTLAVLDAPKPPPGRVSLSAARLSRTRNALFLICGESKRLAVAQWHSGKNIPAAAIKPRSGVDVLLVQFADPTD